MGRNAAKLAGLGGDARSSGGAFRGASRARLAIQDVTGLCMPLATDCNVAAYLAIMAGVIALTYDSGKS